MITSAKVIYEGEGILRLVAPAPDLPLHQELYADILVPEPEFEWDVPYNPSAEAVWGAMGTFGIQDQLLAEWLAFSPEIAEQNQFLYGFDGERYHRYGTEPRNRGKSKLRCNN